MAEFIKFKNGNNEYLVNVDEIVHCDYFKDGERKAMTIYTNDKNSGVLGVAEDEIDRVYKILDTRSIKF